MQQQLHSVFEEHTVPSRPTEMNAVLETLRDTELAPALRLLRELFPEVPFPKRVRALIAARHGAELS